MTGCVLLTTDASRRSSSLAPLRILENKEHGKRIAVIENEYGETSIDDGLLAVQEDRLNKAEEIVALDNGCLCCTVRGDLINALQQLLERRDQFDYIIVETTGLADPSPVAGTFFLDMEIKAKTSLDAIVTVVDCPAPGGCHIR